jgi:hypothetical protein
VVFRQCKAVAKLPFVITGFSGGCVLVVGCVAGIVCAARGLDGAVECP